MATEEEIQEMRRLQAEINRTIDAYNREVVRQEQLVAELNWLGAAVAAAIPVAASMGAEVHHDLDGVAARVKAEELNADQLFDALRELSESYFTYKNLSTATKNITQFTDEYYTVFGYYHELRRITLGYVIGLDTNVISSESARKKVEKAYLQNSEYWLTYCIAATMLWASGEKEAAERGVSKALSLQPAKSALFFLLVNLRFRRLDAAVKWYAYYLDRIDTSKLGDDWQYLLQAHLSGALGGSGQLEAHTRERFNEMIAQVQVADIAYDKKVAARAGAYALSYPATTEFKFALLRECSTDFDELRDLLTLAERIPLLAQEFTAIAEENAPTGDDLATTIEDTLYNLIEAMDVDEEKVYRRIKYNELIVAAKGDLALAQAVFDERFPVDGGATFGDLLMRWAFSTGDTRISPLIRRFSISLLKDWIRSGFEDYRAEYRRREKERYEVHLDGWSFACSEQEADLAAQKYEEHHGKNKWKDFLKDTFVLVWGGACALSLLILVLVIMGGAAGGGAFIVIAVLLGITGAFLLWRRIVDLNAVLADKKRVNIEMIRKTLKELGEWRVAFKSADAAFDDLDQAFSYFD